MSAADRSRRVPRRKDPDGIARARRAGADEREFAFYARKRAKQASRRAAWERANFDPSPPDDETWTAPDETTSDGVRRLRAPTALDDALHEFIASRGWTQQMRDAAVWARWPELVGDELASRCEPVRLTAGTLTIRTDSPGWATQLKYLVTPLRARCDELLGPGVVRSISVVVGPRQPS